MHAKPSWFARFAHYIATGRSVAFFLAVATIVIWGLTGPVFGYSDTWQLVINTATTIVTFLMVFVIQKPRHRSHAHQARRADPRDAEGAQRPARSRNA
jgi:low affinity Fe/Cu permease